MQQATTFPRWIVVLSVSIVLAALTFTLMADDQSEQPADLDINSIMKRAHLTPHNRGTRDNLDNKVLDGKATAEEKKELLELYTALGKIKPPAGTLDEWKKRTDELVTSLKAVYADEKGAAERFTKAKDCKGCHQVHRMPKPM